MYAASARLLAVLVVSGYIATACGASTESLPAATPVTFSSPGSIPAVETLAPTESVPEQSSSSGASSTVAVEQTGPTSSATTSESIPVTGTWENATQGLVGLTADCGNLARVAVRPDSDVLIASVATHGLWSTGEGTDSWSQLGTGRGSTPITNRATTMIFDPTTPDTFWEAGIYGGGVYRTDDGGVTFRQLGDISHVESLSIDLTDPARRTLLATIHESASVFVSTDGGATWQDLSGALPSDVGFATGAVVIDAQTFLLGTSNAPGSKLLRSADAGATWSTVYDAGVIRVPLRAQSDGVMYWLLERVNGIIVSKDNGQTWSLVTPKSQTLPTAPGLIELYDGSLASIGNDRVIRSTDHAATWTSIGPQIPIDPQGVVYSPFRRAFYIWHAECISSTISPVVDDSIMRWNFDPGSA
jgi:photosystem II stability/assembly factor-like uncharacterized protein